MANLLPSGKHLSKANSNKVDLGLNDHLKRQAIKALIPVVKENMPVVEKGVTTFLESIPLREGEEYAGIILYQTPGSQAEANLTLVVFDYENRVTRQIKTISLGDFMELMLSDDINSLLK